MLERVMEQASKLNRPLMCTAAHALGGDGRHGVGSGRQVGLLTMQWGWRKRQTQRTWSGQVRPHQKLARHMAERKLPVESNVSKPVVEAARVVSGTELRKWGMANTRAKARKERKRRSEMSDGGRSLQREPRQSEQSEQM